MAWRVWPPIPPRQRYAASAETYVRTVPQVRARSLGANLGEGPPAMRRRSVRFFLPEQSAHLPQGIVFAARHQALELIADQPLHVRHECRTGSCSPNVHWNAPRPVADNFCEAAAHGSAKVRHHFEVKFITRADGARAGNGS